MKLKRVKHELARLLVICLLFCNTMTVFAENTPSDAGSDQTLAADEQVLAEDEEASSEIVNRIENLEKLELGEAITIEHGQEVVRSFTVETAGYYVIRATSDNVSVSIYRKDEEYYFEDYGLTSPYTLFNSHPFYVYIDEPGTYTVTIGNYNAWGSDASARIDNFTESVEGFEYIDYLSGKSIELNYGTWTYNAISGSNPTLSSNNPFLNPSVSGNNPLLSGNNPLLSGNNPLNKWAPYYANKEITPEDTVGNNKINILVGLHALSSEILKNSSEKSKDYITNSENRINRWEGKLWKALGFRQVISTADGKNPVTDENGYLPGGDYILKFIAQNGASISIPFKMKEQVKPDIPSVDPNNPDPNDPNTPVTPNDPNDPSVPNKVELNATELSLEVGKSSQLTATISPETATEKKGLTWSSSDETVASVDKDGNVTGNKVGSATITVKTENGKEASCKVTVTGGSFSYSVYLYADGNDAADYIIVSMTYGNTDIIPYNQFDKPGYAFVGWNTSADGTGTSYENGQVVSNLTDTNNGIVKLYAQWKKIDNYIIYSLNGGFNNSANPDYYDGRETIKLSDPLRYGYDFNGWYSDATYKNKITEITKGSTGNVILYAKWTPHKYSIKFDANGGTGSMATLKNRSYDSCFELTANKFKRTGYNFIGWNTKADGSGSSYRNRETVSCLTTEDGKDVTLYAQWRQGGYTISYYLYGGYNNWYNPDFYEKGTYTLSFGNPYKSGYEFGGWFSKPGFKANDQVKTISADVGRNLNLYAKWIPNNYTVKFDPNESGIHSGSTGFGSKVSVTGSMSDMTNRVYGKKFNLSANKYKKDGYVFVGWNTRPDGSGIAYKNKASVQNLTSVKGGTVTLYAQWEIVKFPITYKLNGGSVSNSNPSSYSSEDPEIILANPVKTGYTFGGWYSKSNLRDAFKVDKIPSGSQGKKTFYAKWIANSYSVSFEGNGATGGEMEKMTKLYGKKFSLTANKFQKEGYTFAGWNTKADGSGTSYKNKAGVKNLTSVSGGNVVLYAQWNAK